MMPPMVCGRGPAHLSVCFSLACALLAAARLVPRRPAPAPTDPVSACCVPRPWLPRLSVGAKFSGLCRAAPPAAEAAGLALLRPVAAAPRRGAAAGARGGLRAASEKGGHGLPG